MTESEEAFRKFDSEPGFLDFANTAEYQLKNYDRIIDNCSRMLLASPGDSAVFVSSWSTIGIWSTSSVTTRVRSRPMTPC